MELTYTTQNPKVNVQIVIQHVVFVLEIQFLIVKFVMLDIHLIKTMIVLGFNLYHYKDNVEKIHIGTFLIRNVFVLIHYKFLTQLHIIV